MKKLLLLILIINTSFVWKEKKYWIGYVECYSKGTKNTFYTDIEVIEASTKEDAKKVLIDFCKKNEKFGGIYSPYNNHNLDVIVYQFNPQKDIIN